MKSAAPCLIAFTASFTVPKPVMMIAMISGIALERGLEHRAAVDAGQAEVGNDDVEGELGEPRQRVFAVGGLLDDEAVIGEPLRNGLPQRRLVVYEEQMFRVFSHLVVRRYFDTRGGRGQRMTARRALQPRGDPSDNTFRSHASERASDSEQRPSGKT